jgi:hypothetical protein
MTNPSEEVTMKDVNTKLTPEEFSKEFALRGQTAPAEAYAYAKEVGEDKSIKNVSTRHSALFSYAVG